MTFRRHPPVASTLILVLCLGLNLRLGITGASPLIADLRSAGVLTDFSATVMASAPVFVFAVAGFATLPLLRVWGARQTMLLALLLLTVGLVVRGVPQPVIIVFGTIVAATGIAVVNIVLPALVREWFAGNTHRATAAYTSIMAAGAGGAAILALPLATLLGNPTKSLTIWAYPALFTAVLWATLTSPQREYSLSLPSFKTTTLTVPSPKAPWPAGTFALLSYFALQTMLSYIIIGWLPLIATESGTSPETAGMMLGIAMTVGIPATAVIVPAAARHTTRIVGVVLTTACAVTGTAGILLAPLSHPEVWALLLGIGMSGFPFALALLSSIGDTPEQVARVSSLTQVAGYLLGGLGPVLAGWLATTTGNWSVVLLIMIVGALLQGMIGVTLSAVLRRRTPTP